MVSAIIVAAGQGKRFGPGADKLFLEAAGWPIVGHTWASFDRSAEVDEVILVVRNGLEPVFEGISQTIGARKPWRLVAGGSERQDSVWNGLHGTSEFCEIVAIQDGARPCTHDDVIRASIRAAREFGAAVAAQRVTDTLKESADGQTIERTVDRSHLWAVQTPQSFQRKVILRALSEVRRRGLQVTDDTAACEYVGQPVRLVESRQPNPKVTYPDDVRYIEWLLRERRGSGVTA